MGDEMKEIRLAKEKNRYREDALSLFMFFVPGHVSSATITALMLLGAITGVVGGVLMLVWAVVSFFVCLWSYHWVEERRRYERAKTLALIEMPRLASRVMSLYSRSAYSPDEGRGRQRYSSCTSEPNMPWSRRITGEWGR